MTDTLKALRNVATDARLWRDHLTESGEICADLPVATMREIEVVESLATQAPHRSPEDDGVCVICGWPAIVDPAINAVHRRADGRALCWTCDEESPFPAVSQDSEMPDYVTGNIHFAKTVLAGRTSHAETIPDRLDAIVWLAEALKTAEYDAWLNRERVTDYKRITDQLERELEQSRKDMDIMRQHRDDARLKLQHFRDLIASDCL